MIAARCRERAISGLAQLVAVPSSFGAPASQEQQCDPKAAAMH
jgi:hypothetical protein